MTKLFKQAIPHMYAGTQITHYNFMVHEKKENR